MPELRKDPVVGRWVIIATERARRPGNFVDQSYLRPQTNIKDCQFCQDQEEIIYSIQLPYSKNDWDVAVISFKDSFLTPSKDVGHKTNGLYEIFNGFGFHEVIIETKDHVANMADISVEHIQLVFETYATRIYELSKFSEFQYVLPYKNYSQNLQSRMSGHTRSHIIVTPVNPLRVNEKLTGAKKYFDVKKTCVYCDLLNQEMFYQKRIVAETDHFVALVPFAARFLFEVWILPKSHHCDFAHGIYGKAHDLAKMMKLLLQKFKIGLEDPAYNYVIHTSPFRRVQLNTKRWGSIEEDFHWHIELMPQLTMTAGFEKGTGFYICSVPPEMMAEYLRKIEVVVK